jgi:ABC-type nitrate/sulfonate/bicarbonate transport system substrate-binding protein
MMLSASGRCQTLAVLFIGSIALTLLAAGCTVRDGSVARTGEESYSVTVAASTYIGSAPVFAAQHEGYFRDEGLAVNLIVNDTGVESLGNLLRGEAEIALVAELPLVYGSFEPERFTGEDPGPLVIFADMFLSNNISRVLVRRDHGIESADDLRGKTLAAPRGTSIDFLLDLFLLINGLEMSEVNIIDLDVASHVSAIVQGEVDAVFTWQPHLAEAAERLGERGAILPLDLFYHNAWLAVTMKDYAQRRSEVLDSFLRALVRAERFMADHRSEAIAIHAAYADTDPSTIARSWDDVTFWISLSEALLTTMDDEARWLIRTGEYDKAEIPNFLETLETGPMERVKPDGVMVIQ